MINLMTEKARVASFRTRFISDGAKSRNGRLYDSSAVNKLISSAQLALQDPKADPLTCYLSHGAADNDHTLSLVGKITKVTREGKDGWATIDIPDTQAGRDAAVLAKHGYLRTSLRATGAELRMSKEHGVPVVGGSGLKLLGIDFTTTPGLETTIEDVVESHEPHNLSEVFEETNIILEETEQSTDPLTEVSIETLLAEVGKRLSGATTKNLVEAHDAVARTLGMECEGSYDDTADDNPLDPANDGKETQTMTKEEALALLKEAGYDVTAPKSEAQKLQEAFEAKLAEQDAARKVEIEESNKRFEELKALIITKQASPPQRTSLVEGATLTEKQPPAIYKKGSYVAEKLRGISLEDLADRTKPLPDGIAEEHLLKEFGHLMLLDPSRYPSPMNSVLRD